MASPYRELLLDIAREIKPDELEEMKFLSVDFLPGIEQESVLKFFCALEREKRLTEDNLEWLEYLLRKTKRSDLVAKLRDFQSTKPEQSKTATTLSPPEGNTLPAEAHLQTASKTNINNHRQISSCEDLDDKDKDSTKTKEERKKEKKRKYKERKKAAQKTSKEKDDPLPSHESSVKVEQDVPVKEQEETETTKQEVSRNKDKGERISAVKKKENSKTTGKEIQASFKQKKAVEREKQILESPSQQDHQQTVEEHRNLPKDEPKVAEEKNQTSDSLKDDKKHSEEPEEIQEQAKKCALDEPNESSVATKKEEDTQKKKVGNPDLAEMKMATSNKERKDDASTKLCILSLCTKWQSWGESVPVINRELCLALARAGHRVACLVLASSELDKEEARKGNVELIQCSSTPGINREDPQLLLHDQQIPFLPNLVIGHGQLTGAAAVYHGEKSSCPRLHVIHDLPKEYIKYDEVANDQCSEEELARSAEFVAAIGTLLTEKWSALLNKEVFEIVPGLPDLTERNSIFSPQCRCFIPAKYRSPIASGLKIAVMAVNHSSQRESQPRRSTIIVRNTDSSSTKKPSKALKECDRSNVDLVERSGNNCQEAYIDIQGATVFLSPARVEAFGVAALDAMAIGIPIVISANSGLAFTILKYLPKKFHDSCTKEISEDNEDDDADVWAISIDKIAVLTKEAFASADELRSEWKKTFTWDKVVKQLMNTIVMSGKLLPSSPTEQLNTVLTRHVASSCLDVVKDLNLFDKKQKFVLFLSPEDPQHLQNAVHLGLVHWAAVFDFDRESATNGYLKSCEVLLENTGKPACRMIPQSKEDVGRESQNLTLPNGIPWILLQGLPKVEINIEANLDWVQEVLNLVKKKHPNPITILIIWKPTNENKKLCKVLAKLLTLVQASPSWKNSARLEILSTSDIVDSRLEDIAEEWGVEIKKENISQFCNAIYSTAIAYPLYQIDLDFSLPKHNANSATGDVTCATLPSSMRWVDSVLEVLYASVGNTPEYGKNDAYHFYRGGKISWYGIEMNYAVKRESWEPLRNTIEERLGYPGAASLTLFHQRGTGGTTSARQLLYDFHLHYPCVCVKTINYETFLAIKEIWRFCSLPVIILADIKEAPGAEDNDIEVLFGNLSNDKVSCLILHIVHRHQVDKKKNKELSKKETKILAEHLTEKERENFVEVYTLQSRPKLSELANMKYADEQLQIPFSYGLVAFEDQFTGLEPYVSDCLQGLDDPQRTALCFLSMAYHYARRELPLSVLAGIFKLKPTQLHSIEDILRPESIELLIEEDGCWRPRHFTMGFEILRQLLTVPFEIHRDNWKQNLAEKALEFVSCMEEEITNDILLNRISDEKTHKRFSSLIEDIPESEEVEKVFKKAISLYPKNPHFKVHLGRYYSVKHGIDGFKEALRYTDEGILHASGKSKNVRSQLTQMRGIVYKRQVKNLIDREADLRDIISLAEEGVKSFTRAVSISSDKSEDSYIPQVRMMCDVFKYINIHNPGGIFEYSKQPNANRFIVDGISGETSDILESVSESIYYPDLRRELFRLGIRRTGPNKAEDKEDLIKHLQELKKTSKVSTASINRQIVLIRLDLCKEKNKPVSGIAEELNQLLEEALKYDTKIDLTMRLWVRVAPHIPVDLQPAESKIAAWCNKGKSALAYLYRYICTCIRILEGGRDQHFEDERMVARDALAKSVRDTSRINLRHADRPVLFLGTAKGMGQLVTLDRESVKEVRKQRTIPDNYASQLRRFNGIIIKTGKVGLIKAAGLTISFRADLCQPPLVGESYLNKKVRLYLAFTYFETDAYNVKIVTE